MMFARGQQGDVQQVLDAIEQARTGVVVAVAADGRSRAAAPASSGGASTGVVDFAALAHEAPDEADGSEDVGSTPPSVDAGSTVAARLRDLAGLHADGIITDDEFEAKKAELLQQL
jgi:hypothetical protein